MCISACVTEENHNRTLREECGRIHFEKKVLSKIDGLEWMDVTGYWRKIHNERFHNLYWTTKYRSGDIKRTTETHTRIWWGNMKEICYLEELIVNGCIILK